MLKVAQKSSDPVVVSPLLSAVTSLCVAVFLKPPALRLAGPVVALQAVYFASDLIFKS